jgi:hypothetical protein
MPEETFVSVDLNDKARDNLCKLATYLQSLPKNYSHFDMREWYSDTGNDDLDEKYFTSQVTMKHCGTAACACGHGPAAGIPMPKELYDNFPAYGYSELLGQNLDVRTRPGIAEAHRWLFSGEWATYDDHHWSAAARIRFVLSEGKVPGTNRSSYYDPKVYAGYKVDKRVPQPNNFRSKAKETVDA